jgi:HEAT repeat protein
MRAFKEVASVPPAEQPRYVPLLVDGLQGENMEFRLAAVQSLSGFGKNAMPALPAIVQTLEIQHGEARHRLIHDIARLGSLVVPVLISALDEPDPYVVWGACETLAEIGAPARGAIPSLERFVDDSRPEVSHGARAALLILSKE